MVFLVRFCPEKGAPGFDKQRPVWYTYPHRMITGGTSHDERENEDEKRLLLR